MKKILLTILPLLFVAATATAQNWVVNGNANIGAANFLGTTNASDLNFRTNNVQRMTVLGSNGRVGIGIAAPLYAFHTETDSETRAGYFRNNAASVTTYGLYSETFNSGNNTTERAAHLVAQGASGYNYGLWSEARNGATNYGAYTRGVSAANTTAYGLYSQVSGAGTNYAGYFTGGQVYMSYRLGINDDDPEYALDFGAFYGDKISLYSTPNHFQNWHYGLGVQDGLLQIHTDGVGSDIAFGVGRSGQFTEKVRITGDGQLGINEPNPVAALQVRGLAGEHPVVIRDSDNVTKFKVTPNGSVSIGTTAEAPNPNSLVVGDQVLINTATPANGYLLNVNGKAIFEEATVQLSQFWPDYVFAPDYPLCPISDLEKYVQENRHLPGIPTAAEVEQNGIALGEMNRRLTEKVEELTLYIIALEKRLQALESSTPKH